MICVRKVTWRWCGPRGKPPPKSGTYLVQLEGGATTHAWFSGRARWFTQYGSMRILRSVIWWAEAEAPTELDTAAARYA